MKNKLKKLAEKTKDLDKAFGFIKKYRVWFGCGALVFIIAAVAVIFVAVSGGDGSTENDISKEISFSDWGEGVTEGIPEYDHGYDSLDSSDSYMTAYYSNITMEQADNHVRKLETELGITFSNSGKFPKSAVYGEKIIAIHYNVTEMKFSVTVTNSN